MHCSFSGCKWNRVPARDCERKMCRTHCQLSGGCLRKDHVHSSGSQVLPPNPLPSSSPNIGDSLIDPSLRMPPGHLLQRWLSSGWLYKRKRRLRACTACINRSFCRPIFGTISWLSSRGAVIKKTSNSKCIPHMFGCQGKWRMYEKQPSHQSR